MTPFISFVLGSEEIITELLSVCLSLSLPLFLSFSPNYMVEYIAF